MMQEEVQGPFTRLMVLGLHWNLHHLRYNSRNNNDLGWAGVIAGAASNHRSIAAMQHHGLNTGRANSLATGRRHWKAKP